MAKTQNDLGRDSVGRLLFKLAHLLVDVAGDPLEVSLLLGSAQCIYVPANEHFRIIL